MVYDKNEPSYLINGFENGFSLEFVGESPGIESKNLYSAYNKPQINDYKIKKEIAAVRVFGPFVDKSFPDIHCSPLGLVDKK